MAITIKMGRCINKTLIGKMSSFPYNYMRVYARAKKEDQYFPLTYTLNENESVSCKYGVINSYEFPIFTRVRISATIDDPMLSSDIISFDLQTQYWIDGNDGYWYYNSFLEPGEQTEYLFRTISVGDIPPEYDGKTITINIVVDTTDDESSSPLYAAGWQTLKAQYPVFKKIGGTWVKQKAFERVGYDWEEISSPPEKLATPVISLNGNVVSCDVVNSALSYLIYVNGSPTAQFTVVNHYDDVAEFDLAELELPEGNYSITVKADGDGSLIVDSEFSNVVSYMVYPVQQTWQMTVAGLGSSSPSSVTFTTNQGTYPTFEEVTFNGDIFIKIPTMYRKVITVSNNQITSYSISNKKLDNDFQPYTCFVKEDGVTVMPYILIGKFMSSSSSVMKSTGTTGQTSGHASQTITNGRTNARAKGTGYQLYDWQMQKLWQDLITCKMNTVNINTGSGITTDQLGFEWEKSGCFIDGIASPASGNYWTFSYKPTKYIDSPTASSDGYQQVNYNRPTGDGNITALGYDTRHPFVNYPKTASGSTFTTYYCDGYYYKSGSRQFYTNVGYTGVSSGAFRHDAATGWGSLYSVRLCYRPIGE